MQDHVYKKIEITGTSTSSSDEAIRNAIAKASESVKSMCWFEVTELRGDISDGQVAHFQATLKIGFRLEEKKG